ncbi:protein NUCLEAR FUSION DEFECTIVE 4-like isoform X1 [Magnolia sinica]|uniref:protein NUCLEAR FUSION DEFECTIVE 4-like isoform X1 n=1 Tax=Magnolia sinica TaxID=86752 RepID=UPI00265A2F1F|nr:protein NUCLEAR FUSION DEFECTIVE 4-like isoform X1 [Magnolia sinica]
MRSSPQSVLSQWRRRGIWIISSKWLATVASIWIQCTSGSSYCFGIYSSLLKSSQGYDQSTLDTVAFFKDVGANVGLISGLLYSAASSSSSWTRGGPWVVHLAGAILSFSGYFPMWLSVTGAIPRPPVPAMCVFMLLAAQGLTFFNTANVVTAVENFPDHRGTAVGIMKGFLGLSGAILIQVYQTIFKDNPSSFLLMLALLPTLTPLLLMCFVKVRSTNERHDKKYLNGFSVIALVVAFYLTIIIILENVLALGSSMHILILTILLVTLIFPLSIAIRAQLRNSRMLPQASNLEANRLMDDPDPLDVTEQRTYGRVEAEKLRYDHAVYHETPSNAGQESSVHDRRIMLRGENYNLLQSMRTIDFWLLFLATACGMGSGLATVNNISQIGTSLGYTSIETSTLVSLWSIWNFLGRFGAGYVSDYFLHLRGYARPLFMAITLATMSVGHVVIASGLPGALYAGSILVGVCYGSQWSLMPTITSEIFGVMHMGTIFNTITIASPFGSYLLSVKLVGGIYDMEASSSSSSDEKTCTGKHCFMLSFLIMACVTLCGFLVASYLFFRTRRFYKQVIFERLQQSAAQ